MSKTRDDESKGVRQSRTYAQLLGWVSWVLTALIWMLWLRGAPNGTWALLLVPGAVWGLLIASTVRGHRSTSGRRLDVVLCMPVWPAITLVRLIRQPRRTLISSDAGVVPVDRLPGEEFEVRLAHLFRQVGYRVDTTPRTGDFGADLLLTAPDGQTWAVQAKRHDQPVGVKAVQEVIAAVAYYNLHCGMVVTNSTFTPAAREMAQRTGVALWDRAELARAMAAHGPQVVVDGREPLPGTPRCHLLSEAIRDLLRFPRRNAWLDVEGTELGTVAPPVDPHD